MGDPAPARRRRQPGDPEADAFRAHSGRLMTTERDDLSRAQTVLVAAIEAAAPALVEARDIVDAFHIMLRQKKAAGLDD